MESKHTPGPWSVMPQNLRRQPSDPTCPDLYEVPVQCGNVVAMAFSGHSSGEKGKHECLANASLIAAAPDLLEACQALMIHADNGGPDMYDQAVLLARKAIFKATR